MELGLSVIAMLLIGLGLFQAWMLWYLRREHARLDQRIDESLDAEDLVEFQDRIKGLLVQASEAGAELVQTLEKRQVGVDKVLEKAREAELKLLSRLQAMEKLAEGVARRLAAAEQVVQGVPAKPPKRTAKPSGQVRIQRSRPEVLPGPEAPVLDRPAVEAPDGAAERAAEEARRTYLVRSSAPQGGSEGPAATGPSRHQKIYDLADQGLSREQIAREAGVLGGEVDLILNLRPPRRSKS
jgi:hypothetical protein